MLIDDIHARRRHAARVGRATSLVLAVALAVGFLTPAAPPALAMAESEPSVAGRASQPLREWHFAEGNGHPQFQTYFSLLNLADQPASVVAHYHRDDGIRLTQWLGLEPGARLSFSASAIVGPRAFGASFFADQDIVVERSTFWGQQQHAETSLGYTPGGRRGWYFAEGTTRGLVSTSFVFLNLSDLPTTVSATFIRDDGVRVEQELALAPRAREAFRVDDILPDTAFTASFTASEEIVVERTITREGPVGILSGPGFAPLGPEPGSRRWAFAEGSTRRPYLTYFVLFNPNDDAAEARLRFSLEGGGAVEHTLWLPALGRVAFDPSGVVPLADFGVTIEASRPILAERSYFSTGDGLYGTLGHTGGRTHPGARAWYFAEGTTRGQAETYFLLSNLSDQVASVRASYFTDRDGTVERELTVPAFGRLSVRADEIVGQTDFSSRFLADREIVVERTLYVAGWSGFSVVGAGLPQP